MYSAGNNYQFLLSNIFSEAVIRGRIRTCLLLHDDDMIKNSVLEPFLESCEGRGTIMRYTLSTKVSMPYFPVLQYAHERAANYDETKLKELLDASGVYPPLRGLFESALKGSRPHRKEELIVEELEYEKKQICESVMNIFITLKEAKPTILVLENIELLPASTIDFIISSALTKVRMPLLIMMTYNKSGFIYGQGSGAFPQRYPEIEKKSVVIDIRKHYSVEKPVNFAENGQTDKERMDSARDCIAFNAFDDALEVCGKIFDRTYSSSVRNAPEILKLAGDLYYYVKNFDLSILYLQQLSAFAISSQSDSLLQHAYMRLSQAYYQKGNLDSAEKYANLSLKLAEKGGDDRALYHALFTLIVIDDRENRMSRDRWISFFERVTDLAEKLGYMNAVAFWLTRHDRFDAVTHEKEIERMIDRAISVSTEIRNTMRLAAAYHAKGLFCILKNKYDEVSQYYKKSEELTLQTGNLLRMAQLCNGFGYFNFQCGRHADAERYFIRAYMYGYEIRDFHEIAMSVCNTAINYLMALQFSAALVYFEKLQDMLEILGIKELPYHSDFGVNSLIAICYYRTGKISKFLEKFTYLNAQISDRSNHARLQNFMEEEFYFYLIASYYCEITGDTDGQRTHLADAEIFLKDYYDLLKYLFPFYYYDLGKFALKKGDIALADTAAKKGMEACGKLKYRVFERAFDSIRERILTDPVIFQPTEKIIDFARLFEAANVSKSLLQLHRKVEELDYLNILQKAISDSDSVSGVAAAACRLIINKINVDSIAIFRKTADKIHVLDAHSGFENDIARHEKFLDAVSSVSENSPTLLLSTDRSDKFSDFGFSSAVFVPHNGNDDWSLEIFCATTGRNKTLTENDFLVLSITAQQIVNKIISIEQMNEIRNKNRLLEEANDLLFVRATTDSLTKLYNRHSILQKIHDANERNKRRGESNKENHSIIFADLDNFKFFNDSFGHDVGDLILTEFAGIIKLSTRACDSASRFGGDEFVIFLPDTGTDGACVIAERILSHLKNANSFRAEIERKLGRTIEIPDGKNLGCSIGISGNGKNFLINGDAMIRNADIALYASKEGGRNRYTVHM